MKIRTQFIITMLLFGVIMVVIALSAILTGIWAKKIDHQENLASSIVQGASELSYLSNDYLIYRESQQLSRWQSRFRSFSDQVSALSVDKPEQQVLVRNIQANSQRLGEVFDSVISALRSSPKTMKAALDSAFIQVSWSRVAVQSQALISDASRLSHHLRQQRDRLIDARTTLIYVMVGLFGLLLFSTYMLTYGRVLRSIAILREGARIIGSGHLDFKIKERKKDEIGDLSHAFNQMTSSLKNVTASKTDLEREITERKRVEEELRNQREWLRITLSSIGDAVIASDTEGRITFLNPVAETLTGWKSEEALGQPVQSVFRIINEKTGQPAENLVVRVLSEKRNIDLANDTALVTKDGREVAIEDSAAPILDAGGNITGTVLVFHDVTQRRRAQEALREAHEKAVWLARFPEENPNPVLRVATDGRVLYRNPATSEFPGWGYQVGNVLPESLLALVIRALTEKLELEQEMEFEGRFYAIWVAPFPEEGYTNIYARDVTKRRQAEKAVQQKTLELQRLTETLEQRVRERTEELEEANKTLRELSVRLLSAQEEERKRVAGDIHDTMGSYLSGIKFRVENALDEIKKTPKAAAESLTTIIPVIHDAVEECRRIQMDLRPSMLDDLGLLPTLSWFCRKYQTIYNSIRVEQEMGVEESELPDSLKIVIYRITQEAMNNIAKHSHANYVRLSLRKLNNEIELCVEDNGRGFSAQPRVLQDQSGRGLGLTSMKERAALSGGSFAVESAEGKGTVIRAWWSINIHNHQTSIHRGNYAKSIDR